MKTPPGARQASRCAAHRSRGLGAAPRAPAALCDGASGNCVGAGAVARGGGALRAAAHARRARRLAAALRAAARHAGGHDRDAHAVAERLVEGGADDDVGFRIDFLAHAAGGLVDLVQRQVAAAGDRQQQALGALERDVVEQRIGDGLLGRDRWRAARRRPRRCPSWPCPCRSSRCGRRRSRG